MTLVFVSMFTVIFASLAGLVSRTYRQAVLQAQDETAFHIAEAGLNFARWRLAHDPDNYAAVSQNVTDQLAGVLGSYDLTFVAPQPGSSIVMITSVGQTVSQPGRPVTLTARYGRPSLARYAAITNDDVWYGGGVFGPAHANGGIRMSGSSDSTLTSAQETYACQPFHGCAAPFETKDGVWGSGTNQELWEFPVPPVDYTAVTSDLLTIKAAAQAAGTYYGPSSDYGYELVFHDTGSYTISRVTARGPHVWSWTPATGWEYTSHDVGTTVLVETKAVPSNGVVYVEDRVWVRGDIRDRVTVAAGVFPDTPATQVDIIVHGNISYDGVNDGTRAFAAIAQRHVMLPWSGAPDELQLDGAFIAQQGSFHRRHYPDCCGAQAHRLKSSLTRFGMVASNGVPGTAWVDGSSAVISGFESSQASYDPNFLYGPPPYFPVQGDHTFISWEEQ